MKIFILTTTVVCLSLVVYVVKNPTSLLNLLSYDSKSCKKADVIFQAEKQLKADIYYADTRKCQQAPASDRPTLVFIYGGGWKSGDKSAYSFIANFFTQHGYNVVIPNYRLFPEAAYPEFIIDLSEFFDWLSINANKHQLNTGKLVLMGHSAGAYNAATYLFDDSYKKVFDFRAFIGLAGPYDFFLPTEDPKYQDVFEKNGKDGNSQNNMPIYFVNNLKRETPIVKRAFILHGNDDTIVTPKNIERFSEALEKKNISTRAKLYEGVGHAGIIAGVSHIALTPSEVGADIVEFLEDIKN